MGIRRPRPARAHAGRRARRCKAGTGSERAQLCGSKSKPASHRDRGSRLPLHPVGNEGGAAARLLGPSSGRRRRCQQEREQQKGVNTHGRGVPSSFLAQAVKLGLVVREIGGSSRNRPVPAGQAGNKAGSAHMRMSELLGTRIQTRLQSIQQGGLQDSQRGRVCTARAHLRAGVD